MEIEGKDLRVGTSSANLCLRQGVLALPWPCNVALREDALALLRPLSIGCTPLVFFDPQYREVLDKLAYGNEGARQRERCALPAMTTGYIDACCREIARVLQPSGYLMLWSDTFRLCEGAHQRGADVVKCVDLICLGQFAAWQRLSQPAARRLSARAAEATAASEGDVARSPYPGQVGGEG